MYLTVSFEVELPCVQTSLAGMRLSDYKHDLVVLGAWLGMRAVTTSFCLNDIISQTHKALI